MRLPISIHLKEPILFFYLAIAGGLRAQENRPAPSPHEPLLVRAPEMAAWTITYQYPDEKEAADKKHRTKKAAKNPGEQIVSVQFEKTGDIYHKITRLGNGKEIEAWSVQGREVIKGEANSQYVPTSANGPAADDFTNSDFEDLEWLAMKFYVAPKKSGENFTFHAKHKNRPLTRHEKLVLATLGQSRTTTNKENLQTQVDSLADSEAADQSIPSPEAEETVVLDAATQLPIEYDQGAVKWRYEFGQAPGSMLEPPVAVNTLLNQWNSFIKSSESAGSPP